MQRRVWCLINSLRAAVADSLSIRAGKEIRSVAGADNVQVTFSSTGKNVACYSARINDEQASALRQLPVIQYVLRLAFFLLYFGSFALMFWCARCCCDCTDRLLRCLRS